MTDQLLIGEQLALNLQLCRADNSELAALRADPYYTDLAKQLLGNDLVSLFPSVHETTDYHFSETQQQVQQMLHQFDHFITHSPDNERPVTKPESELTEAERLVTGRTTKVMDGRPMVSFIEYVPTNDQRALRDVLTHLLNFLAVGTSNAPCILKNLLFVSDPVAPAEASPSSDEETTLLPEQENVSAETPA